MKKQLIATLVGAIILFVWQFLSWAVLPVHHSEYGYTPNQDKILEALNQNLTEAGTYMIPGVPPGTPHEQAEAAMQSSIGKPWARVSYHKSFSTDMGMNMLRGFTVDLLAIFLMVWLLLQFAEISTGKAIRASLSVGIIAYLTIPYLNNIWFEEGSAGHLVDAIVPWALIGVWLGWWLPRR